MNSWDAIEAKALNECIPLRGIIELNYSCNFRCIHCYLDEKRGASIQLNREQCRLVFERLQAAGTLTVTFTGGEPFLNPDFAAILRDAREARLAVRIFTNASLVGEKEADLLAEIQPLSIDISLYGATEQTYAAMTGRDGEFARIVAAIERLRSRSLVCVLKIIAHRLNLDELRAMEMLAQRTGCKTVMTPLLTPTDCGDLSPCGLMLKGSELEDYFEDYGKASQPQSRAADQMVCTSGRNSFVISPEGDVFPCIQIREKVGNILQAEFSSFWNENPSDLLQQLRDLTFDDLGDCTGCEAAAHCFFCPGLARLTTGKLTSRFEPACTFAHILARRHSREN